MFCALGSQIMAPFLKPLGACLTTKQSLGWTFVVLSMPTHPHPMLSISWSLPGLPTSTDWDFSEIMNQSKPFFPEVAYGWISSQQRNNRYIFHFTKRDRETLKAEQLRLSILSPCIIGFLPYHLLLHGYEVSAVVIETRFYSLIMYFFHIFTRKWHCSHRLDPVLWDSLSKLNNRKGPLQIRLINIPDTLCEWSTKTPGNVFFCRSGMEVRGLSSWNWSKAGAAELLSNPGNCTRHS